METVFDHNITADERIALFGSELATKDFYLSLGGSQRDYYGDIYRLYTYRGDHITAKKYADMIPNDIAKVFGLCNHDFAVKR